MSPSMQRLWKPMMVYLRRLSKPNTNNKWNDREGINKVLKRICPIWLLRRVERDKNWRKTKWRRGRRASLDFSLLIPLILYPMLLPFWPFLPCIILLRSSSFCDLAVFAFYFSTFAVYFESGKKLTFYFCNYHFSVYNTRHLTIWLFLFNQISIFFLDDFDIDIITILKLCSLSFEYKPTSIVDNATHQEILARPKPNKDLGIEDLYTWSE